MKRFHLCIICMILASGAYANQKTLQWSNYGVQTLVQAKPNYYSRSIAGHHCTLTSTVGLTSTIYESQKSVTSLSEKLENEERISIGIGLGLDHGGVGVNLCAYPQRNIGIFLGAGYASIGPGYNGGLKFRLSSNKLTPYLSVLYGYNAVVSVTNISRLNKMYYGFTFGLGCDIRRKPERKGYFSLGLLIPIRDKKVKQYMDFLERKYGVDFKGGLLPFGISVGYRFIIT